MSAEIINELDKIQQAIFKLKSILLEQQKPHEKTSPDIESTPPKDRLIPLTKWNKYHDWPTIGALRAYIHEEYKNGFAVAFKRVGRKIVIDEKAFFQWVEDYSKPGVKERLKKEWMDKVTGRRA